MYLQLNPKEQRVRTGRLRDDRAIVMHAAAVRVRAPDMMGRLGEATNVRTFFPPICNFPDPSDRRTGTGFG